MIYRMRIYETVRDNLPTFHEFFRTHLLPVQLRHGARLVGRWETADGRVVAVWEYDDLAAYERIDAAVRSDPGSRDAQERRATLPRLILSQREYFMTSTLAEPRADPRTDEGGTTGGSRVPVLRGQRVTLRAGNRGDVAPLRGIMADESVTRWWGDPEPAECIAAKLRGDASSRLLVIEIDGEVAGGIQYPEEDDPRYRHAGIDIYLGDRYQGRGAGTEAISLLARCLFEQRGHHRITIDPAAANHRAIRCYQRAGFRRSAYCGATNAARTARSTTACSWTCSAMTRYRRGDTRLRRNPRP